jgi:hypothetical protein
MALSKRTRFEVFKRDKFTCQYCGRRPPEVVLEVDHIHPRVEGGTDDIHNLTTACLPCNRGKAGIPLDNLAPALDELEVLEGVQEMLERMMNLRRSAAVAEAKRDYEDEAIDTVHGWWLDCWPWGPRFERPSVRQFVQQLDMEDLRAAVDATYRRSMRRDKESLGSAEIFRYFCGVCRNMIRERGEV